MPGAGHGIETVLVHALPFLVASIDLTGAPAYAPAHHPGGNELGHHLNGVDDLCISVVGSGGR
jgi:hypothetical protein